MGIPRKFTEASSIMLRPILFFLVVFSMYLADIEVDVSDDLESMSEQDRTIVCGFTGQLRCSAACNGRPCTSVCQATCGYIIRRTVNFTCSAVAASTCTA